MSESTKQAALSRRAVLQGLGIGAGGVGLLGAGACGLGPNRCAGGPVPRTDGASAGQLAHVDHVVVLMLENRSFDHLLGALRTDRSYPDHARVNGLLGNEANPHPDGRMIATARMPGRGDGSFSPAHDYGRVRQTWNGGRNDRFVAVNDGKNVAEVMSHLTRDQVPFMHALADNFTICDRWFSSYMGQTWPNRFYLHATTANGKRENRPLGVEAPPTIWEGMGELCRSTRNYGAGPFLWYTTAMPVKALSGSDAMQPGTIEDFFVDARKGNLPELSIVDPSYWVNDFSPGNDITLGEAFAASVYRALAESPQWGRLLFVVTFDEHGGFYDHVPPPETVDPRAEFRQLGFRVPTFVIGPTVWQGRVVSTQFEHVSIASTLRTRFGIASLGARMDVTNDLSSCIDPARVAAPAPPSRGMPRIEVSERQSLRMAAAMPPSAEREELRATVPVDLVDPRSDEERFGSWLRLAQELDVVKVVK